MTFEKCWEVLPLPGQMLQYDVYDLTSIKRDTFLGLLNTSLHEVPAKSNTTFLVPDNVFHRAHLEMAAVYEAVVRSVECCRLFLFLYILN